MIMIMIKENYYKDKTMGEMADYSLEQSDYFDFSYNNIVECKYCKQDGLIWEETGKGWRLYDGNTPHECKEYAKAHWKTKAKPKNKPLVRVLRTLYKIAKKF